MKLKVKKCPECSNGLTKFARGCGKCGFKYPPKKKIKYEQIKKWQELKKGDIIYIRKNCGGAYFKGEQGKILMAARGKFTVMSVEKKGLWVYSVKDGCSYLNMTEKGFCDKTNLFRRPYKLMKKI